MKKIDLTLFITFFIFITSCRPKATVPSAASVENFSTESTSSSAQSKILYYQCPMHHQIHKNEPGTCPICGMTLVPIYEENHSQSSQNFFISTERQQLIGVKKVEVRQGPATAEIRTAGRIAFDPELATAQAEYVSISKNIPDLKKSAHDRLILLGMSEEEIKSLEKNPKNSRLWVYATLFADEVGQVHLGDSVKLVSPYQNKESLSGTVKGISPVMDANTRAVRARIEAQTLADSSTSLWRLGMSVDVIFQISLGEQILIPRSSVIDTGTRKIVYVTNEKNEFSPRLIQTDKTAGSEIIVSSGLHKGEWVVSEATFLVDAESQLKGINWTELPKNSSGVPND